MLKKIRFYISPFFLIRHYLERDAKFFVKKHKFEGKVLDLGCGQKPYQHIFKNSDYVGIDFKNYSKNKDIAGGKPDFYFDEKYPKDFRLPFENGSFRHAVSFQVLEHHKKPELMISEMARVAGKGGLILISCPFVYALHEEPNDFQRLTHHKLKDIFEKNNCAVVEVKKQGGFFSAVSMLANEQLNFFAAKSGPNYFIAFVCYPFFLIFQYFSLLADLFIKPKAVFPNYLILAKKNENSH
jgi:SAM-dependent methyltransferase